MAQVVDVGVMRNEVTLKKGIKIGECFYKKISLNSPTLGDMIEADNNSTDKGNLAYQVALVARCISKIEGLPEDMVISPSMLESLSPIDWFLLKKKMDEVDAKGED